MKASLVITNGTYQILLEGESEQETQIIRAMHKKTFIAYESDFEIELCKAGYYRTFNNAQGVSEKSSKQVALVCQKGEKHEQT